MRWGRVAPTMLAAAALGATVTACQPKATSGWRSQLVSINAAGTATAGAASEDPVFSPDGTKIAFVSWATDLGPQDTGFFSDIYLRDLTSGEVTLVSANGAGTGGGNEDSFGPVFSPDGTRIAFVSRANDLGPTDQGAREDVYVHDLATGTTSLVSVDAAGTGSGTWPSFDPVFDPTDSDRLVFTSGADNLQGSDPDGNVNDLYLRDLAAGTTTLLTGSYTPSTGGASTNAAFSSDGRMLTFESRANLVPGFVRTSSGNVYVRDMETGQFTPVSWNAAHTGSPNVSAEDPAINADGTLVAYTSHATDIAEGDTDILGRQRDIFVHDLTTGTTTLGSPGEMYHVDLATFSPDGAAMAYTSGLVDLTRIGGELQVSPHTEPEGGFAEPVFGPDGQSLLIQSRAQLDPRDGNISQDVYLLDLDTGEVQLISANDAQNGTSDRGSGPAVFSPHGTSIAFVSDATELTAIPDPGQFTDGDIFVARFVDAFAEADLSVTSAADPTPVPAGADLTYQVTVTNEGSVPAENVSIAFGKPSQLHPATIDITQGTCGDFGGDHRGTLTCQAGTLHPGASAQLTVVVGVMAPTGTTLESGVVVDLGPTLDPNSENNAALTTVVVT